MKLAYESEIFTELVLPTCLSPFDVAPIAASAERTGRLLTIEEGTRALGWGAEVLAQVNERLPGLKNSARVAALDLPVPAAPALEQVVLPQVEDIIAAAKKMV